MARRTLKRRRAREHVRRSPELAGDRPLPVRTKASAASPIRRRRSASSSRRTSKRTSGLRPQVRCRLDRQALGADCADRGPCHRHRPDSAGCRRRRAAAPPPPRPRQVGRTSGTEPVTRSRGARPARAPTAAVAADDLEGRVGTCAPAARPRRRTSACRPGWAASPSSRETPALDLSRDAARTVGVDRGVDRVDVAPAVTSAKIRASWRLTASRGRSGCRTRPERGHAAVLVAHVGAHQGAAGDLRVALEDLRPTLCWNRIRAAVRARRGGAHLHGVADHQIEGPRRSSPDPRRAGS